MAPANVPLDGFHFGQAHSIWTHKMANKVSRHDDIVIDQRETADAGAYEHVGDERAQCADADDRNTAFP